MKVEDCCNPAFTPCYVAFPVPDCTRRDLHLPWKLPHTPPCHWVHGMQLVCAAARRSKCPNAPTRPPNAGIILLQDRLRTYAAGAGVITRAMTLLLFTHKVLSRHSKLLAASAHSFARLEHESDTYLYYADNTTAQQQPHAAGWHRVHHQPRLF